ncbi:MAG: hypothetical protein ABIH65_03460 [Nanoarchaeota archaeon]
MNKEYKHDCDKMHIVEGKLVKSKDDYQNLIDFVKRWELKCKDIQKQAYDNQQCYDISMMFIDEWAYKFFYQDKVKNKLTLINQLSNDFRIAVIKANNNYKKENRTFWNLFFKDKLKLPDLHLHTKRI